MFAFTVIPILALVGMAVDYKRAYNTRSSLQASLDIATLASLHETADQKVIKAASVFTRNLRVSPSVVITPPVFTIPTPNTFHGTASATIPTTLLSLIGINTIDVSVNSTSSAQEIRAPLCFMAMHPTRKHTLELKETVSVLAPNCHIYGNSSHFDDVVDPHTPQNHLTGKSVQAIGFGHHFLVNVTPPLEHAPELIPDPLASKIIPLPGACDYTNKIITGGVATLNPGTYCGGLTIQNTANVTMNPGLYIIQGGKLSITGSSLTGTGISIVLADNLAELAWTNATVRLAAPETGLHAGIVMMGRKFTNHLLTASTVDLHGVIYLPHGKFIWRNTGTPIINASWTAWITDGVTWTGDGTININFNIHASNIPYPTELYVLPRPGRPRLVN